MNGDQELSQNHSMADVDSYHGKEKSSPRQKNPITDEMRALCLVPLQDGWRREIRMRNTTRFKKIADVYYSSPTGLRFRSRLQVMKYLETNSITKYTQLNFSFREYPLGGVCSPYEVISMAQSHSHFNFSSTEGTKSYSPIPSVENGNVFDTLKPTASNMSKKRTRNLFGPAKRETPDQKLYCICSEAEQGQMVKCHNVNCVLKLYHSKCIKEVPGASEVWYCPICRGTTSATLNPLYAEPPSSYC